jgi:cytidine deaminase
VSRRASSTVKRPTAPPARELLAAARKAASQAHAPYSKFKVGAAVADERGRIFSAGNIENASYGLTVCAERVAIFSAIAAGARRITAVGVTSRKLKPVAPCGACRQVMTEFAAPSTPVYLDAGRGKVVEQTVASLMPAAFDAAAFARKS